MQFYSTMLLYLMGVIFIFSCKSNDQTVEIDPISTEKFISISQFPSDNIEPVHVDILLPESYDPSQKYPVLYMNDGQNLFNPPESTYNGLRWELEVTTKKLEQEGRIRPLIVVGIWNQGPKRTSQYFPQKVYDSLSKEMKDSLAYFGEMLAGEVIPVYSDDYLKFIVQELKPYIDQNYNSLSDQQHSYIGGSSMGGLISMYAVCEYPDVFAGALCMSTHWIGTFSNANKEFPNQYIRYLNENIPSSENHKFYFDFGTSGLDEYYERPQLRVDSLFQKNGYTAKNYKTMKYGGHGHNEEFWSKRTRRPLEFFFPVI